MLAKIVIILLFSQFCYFGLSSKKRKAINDVELENINKATLIKVLVSSIAMILVATYRPIEMADRQNYVDMLKYLSQEQEIGYNAIEYFVHIYCSKNEYVLFFIMATIAVSLKTKAIVKLSNHIWLAMAIYLSSKFILQEMIQIRSAVSTGVFLICCQYKFTNNPLKYFLGVIVAVLFHWTALLMIPIWFLSTKRIHNHLFIFAIVSSFCLGYFGMSASRLIGMVPIGEIQALYYSYASTNELQSSYNLFSIVMLSRVLLCIILLIYSNLLNKKDKRFIFFIQIYALSMIIYPLFGDITVVAIRFSEFYQIVEIILIPMICNLFKDEIFGKIFTLTIGGIYLFFNLFITNYIQG